MEEELGHLKPAKAPGKASEVQALAGVRCVAREEMVPTEVLPREGGSGAAAVRQGACGQLQEPLQPSGRGRAGIRLYVSSLYVLLHTEM